MSSADCQAQINFYSEIKKQLLSINNSIDDCILDIINGEKLAELLIIDGKQIDEELLGDANVSLGNVKTDLSTLIGECDALISKYQNLLNEALTREIIHE